MSMLPNWLVWLLIVFSGIGVVAVCYLLTQLAWFTKEFLVARRDFYRRGGSK